MQVFAPRVPDKAKTRLKTGSLQDGGHLLTAMNRERQERAYRPFRLAGITLHDVHLRENRRQLVENLPKLVDNDPKAVGQLGLNRLALGGADAFRGGGGWYNVATIVRVAGTGFPAYPECPSLPPGFDALLVRLHWLPDGNMMMSYTFIIQADNTEHVRHEFIESHDFERVEVGESGGDTPALYVQKQDPFHHAREIGATARAWLAERVPGIWMADENVAQVPSDLVVITEGLEPKNIVDGWEEVLRFLDWNSGAPIFGTKEAYFFFHSSRSQRRPIDRGCTWLLPSTTTVDGNATGMTNWQACHEAVEAGFAVAGLVYHDVLCSYFLDVKAPLLHDLEVRLNRDLVKTTEHMRTRFLGGALSLTRLQGIVADLAVGIRDTEFDLNVLHRSRTGIDSRFLSFRLRGLKSIFRQGPEVDLEQEGPAFLERIYRLTDAALEDAHRKLLADDAFAGRYFQSATATSNWRLAIAVAVLALAQVLLAYVALR